MKGTLNPALDKSTTVEKMVAEKKMRCSAIRVEAGGGGINVSKAIKELEGESVAVFPAGGINGDVLQKVLDDIGVRYQTVKINNETRENFVATELSSNAQYRFVMPGQSLTDKEIESCLDIVEELKPSFLVFSGSLPPNASDDLPARIAAIAKERGIRFIVDTSGQPLKNAVETGVFLLKPNLSELCFLTGVERLEISEIDDAARSIIDKGKCEAIAVSMGPSGALLVTKDTCKRIPAPTVKKLSTVGAGDSMVAGIVWSLMQNKPLVEAVQFGVACGTAATMNAGTQLFKKNDALRLFEWIKAN